MKRSEALAILRQREVWSHTYECLSIKQDCEEYFSHSGCEVCDAGAGSVYDVIYLAQEDTAKQVFNNVYDGQMCGGCISALTYGDNSDLDFHVDDEDCHE